METTTADRVVVRCPRCLLNQFRTRNERCRRCGISLLIPVPMKILVELSRIKKRKRKRRKEKSGYNGKTSIGRAVRTARDLGLMSQYLVASGIRMTRSYIARVEIGNVIPGFRIINKLAEYYHLPQWCFWYGEDVVELLWFFERVDPMRQEAVLEAARQMILSSRKVTPNRLTQLSASVL